MMTTISEITNQQKKIIMTLAVSQLGLKRDVRLQLISNILDKKVDTIVNLNEEEGNKIIKYFDFLNKFIETHYEKLPYHMQTNSKQGSLFAYGEEHLFLSKFQQIDLISYLYNMNINENSPLPISLIEELYSIYDFVCFFMESHLRKTL